MEQENAIREPSTRLEHTLGIWQHYTKVGYRWPHSIHRPLMSALRFQKEQKKHKKLSWIMNPMEEIMLFFDMKVTSIFGVNTEE